MSIIILSVVVLGSVFYIFFTLFSYSEKSSPLSSRLRDLRMGIAQKKQRLAEYQERVEILEEEVPNWRAQYDRRERWVELLRDQKRRLDTERAQAQKKGPGNTDSAIRKGLLAARRWRRQ